LCRPSLGYGPIAKNSKLKGNAAIQDGEAAILRLALPSQEAANVLQALALINLYGALGGRSRNGWGSVTLTPADDSPTLRTGLHESFTAAWQDALRIVWPQSIGRDDARRPLIWRTDPVVDWRAVMHLLARIKIDLRTKFTFTIGRDARAPEERHWLSYPVTNHSVKPWGDNARLPNSLRFKVRPTPDGRLQGVMFHMPCLPPPEFVPDRPTIEKVWRTVHAYLDKDARLKRAAA
jgi:CRISPR-associated protein Cmr1